MTNIYSFLWNLKSANKGSSAQVPNRKNLDVNTLIGDSEMNDNLSIFSNFF